MTTANRPETCTIDDCGNPRHPKIVALRRLIGLPDDGPTREQMARWCAEEIAEVAS